MDTLNLTAPDISCDHCQTTIEREIKTLPGVIACAVDVPTKQIQVTFDSGQVSREQIVEKLDEEGYPVEERRRELE